MGNTHGGRKRRAVEDELTPEPRRKRMRMEESTGERPWKRVRMDREGAEKREEEEEYECSQTPSTSRSFVVETNPGEVPPRKRKRLQRLSKLLSFSSNKLHATEKEPEPVINRLSNQSISSLDRESMGKAANGMDGEGNFVSCSALSRAAWPTPWLETLFLPEFPSKNTVTENNFAIMNEIGRGAFGCVFRVVAKKDVRGVYALKVMEKSRILARNAAEQIKREVGIQKQLAPYTFIARLFTCWQNRSSLFCLLQYAVGSCGDLFAVWRDYGPFPEETIRLFAAEFSCALDYMHRNGVVYRDLKLENVVVDADGHILLVDFGLAKTLRPGLETRTICGTLQYMAPEISKEESYGHWVDWWSMGVLLHILYTNRYPYPNADVQHHRDLRFIDYSTPPECSPELGSFFDRILNVSHLRRMCCFEVIHAHPFFSGINFEDIEQRRFSPLSSFPWFDRCPSCNTDKDSDASDADESLFGLFDEKYEFKDFEYLNDKWNSNT